MRELIGDLWEAWEFGHWIVITTNGGVTKSGRCVMGRGVAKEAAEKFPDLPLLLGEEIRKGGNHVHAFSKYHVMSFPVKRHWRELVSMALIIQSANELVVEVSRRAMSHQHHVYMVRPGCGNGGLRWENVKPKIQNILLDSRFVVLEHAKEN